MIFNSIFHFVAQRATIQSFGHPSAGIIGWMSGVTKSGAQVTDGTSLSWSAIWAARNKIASALAQLPCKLKHRIDDGSSPDAVDDPLYWALSHEPNPEMDSFIFWEMMFDRWVNFGNAYAEIVREGNRVTELWPIHPTRVFPARNTTGLYYEVTAGGGRETLDRSEILNIVGPLSEDGVTGRGVIDYARESIGVALANQDYQSAYFSNGAVPRGVVTHPAKMPPEGRQAFREEWNRVHGGGGNYGKLAILWEGMKYEAIGDNAEDSGMLEKLRFSTEEVARWYDLPPHVIRDLTRSTNNNIESEQRSLVVDSYGPRLKRVEKAVDRQLIPREQKRNGYYVKFNVEALLRGDPEKRVDVQNKRLLHGHITLNDIMRQEDMQLLPPEVGDVRFFPLNHTTVEKAIAQEVPEEGDEIPGDPSGSDTPDDMQPGRPPERQIVEAVEQAVAAQLRRLVGVEAKAVQRLARKPNEFIAGIEEFYEGHAERMREALAPSLYALQVAGGEAKVSAEAWCEESTRQLIEAAGCLPEQFERRIKELCESWSGRIGN